MATTVRKPASTSKKVPSKKPPKTESAPVGPKRAGRSEPGKASRKSKSASSKAQAERAKSKTAKARTTKALTPDGEAESADEPRRLGIRGAAPWAARHAAKHAAEARARAAEPPPPGSARATLREPTGAEEIKARVVELHNALAEIKSLRKNLGRNFYDIGLLLRDIRERRLYEARGFGSFEALLDREVDIGKTTSLRLTQVVDVFQKEAALHYGMDHVLQALATLETGQRQRATVHSVAVGAGPAPLPLRPPMAKK